VHPCCVAGQVGGGGHGLIVGRSTDRRNPQRPHTAATSAHRRWLTCAGGVR
jgi:hypothetical protein